MDTTAAVNNNHVFSRRSASKIFADTALAARFWFVVALILGAVCILEPFALKLLEMTNPKEKLIVLDQAGNVVISRYEDLWESKTLVNEIALQSAHCLLTLSENGMEQKEFLSRIFTPKAVIQAEEIVRQILEKFPEGARFFQGIKVYKINSRNNPDAIFVKAEAQAVRSGTFVDGQAFHYEEPLELWLQLVKNPDMLDGKRWPLVVSHFELRWATREE